MDVAFIADGAVNHARGTRGGHNGAGIANFRRRANGTLKDLPAVAVVTLLPGERIVSYSAGGGGYGSPRQRAAELVQRDVAEHWISRARAESVYGVKLTGAGQIDARATRALRRAKRRALKTS